MTNRTLGQPGESVIEPMKLNSRQQNSGVMSREDLLTQHIEQRVRSKTLLYTLPPRTKRIWPIGRVETRIKPTIHIGVPEKRQANLVDQQASKQKHNPEDAPLPLPESTNNPQAVQSTRSPLPLKEVAVTS
jgi:hypothetical protein